MGATKQSGAKISSHYITKGTECEEHQPTIISFYYVQVEPDWVKCSVQLRGATVAIGYGSTDTEALIGLMARHVWLSKFGGGGPMEGGTYG